MTTKRSAPQVSRTHFTRTVKALRREMAALKADADKRVKAAYWSGVEDHEDEPPTTAGTLQYRRRGYRTVRATPRDETTTSQEAAIQRSYRQYATNPLAYAMYNLRADYVWGDGPTVTADNDEVQEVIDDHLYDDVNDWEGKGHQRVRDLSMYGELCLECFVRWDGILGDGHCTIGAIDPSEIDQIITDPDNREDIIAIRLKGIPGEQQQKGRILKIIRTDPETKRLVGVKQTQFAAGRQYEAGDVMQRDRRRWRVTEANRTTDKFDSGWSNVRAAECCYGRAWRVSEAGNGRMAQDERGQMVNGEPYAGQCFLTQVNKTSIGLRGRPDGLSLIDWLDRGDQFFFDVMEYVALLRDKVWDLLVQGGDDKEVLQRVNEFVAARNSGGVWGHNEALTLQAINPDLKSSDIQQIFDTLLAFLSAGARLPVYMLGSGGDANLATATAQGSPTYRGFETRQGVVSRMLTRELQYVIDCAVEAGRIPESVTLLDENGQPQIEGELGLPVTQLARDSFEVQMPEISPRDTAAAATTFAAVVTAAAGLYAQKLLPLQVVIEIIARVAELLGVDLDVDKVVEALQAENAPDTSAFADALDGLKDADPFKAALGDLGGSANGTLKIPFTSGTTVSGNGSGFDDALKGIMDEGLKQG